MDPRANEVGIGEDGGEAKKCKKPYKSCRRDQALSSRTRHHPCRQGVDLVGTRQLRSRGPVSVYTQRTKGVTGSEGQEGADEVGGGIGVGGGNGDVNGDGYGDGTGTGAGVEVNEGTHDGNGNRKRDGTGTETGTGVEPRERA